MITDKKAMHTPGPIYYSKCQCGDPICEKYHLQHASDGGLSLADARLYAAAPELLESLAFYVRVCGNTGYSITRETALEMYAKGSAALAKGGAQLHGCS